MDEEFQKELKLLPERKRRTFLRYLQQQEKSERNYFLKF
jgi:mRNA-degrading endonuclease RelE of RelBE toxin-antitoxin system